MIFSKIKGAVFTARAWLKANPLDAALILGVGFVGLFMGLWARVVILDDALITFRVAENLAYGQGFVYNPGERVQVTTTPLYAILLAVGVWVLGSALTAAQVINIALSTLIPILAYSLGRALAGRITGVAGALLLTTAPLLVIAFSMESYLYVALILATMNAYMFRRYRLAGVLTGLTAMVRGDAASLGACLLIYDVLAYRRFRWSLIVPAIGLPALWYLFATLYYGAPFPATLGAKVAQGEFDWLGQGFLEGFYYTYWDIWVRRADLDMFLLIPGLIILGALVTLWAERAWLIMLGRDLLYIVAFVGLGVPSAEWYYAPVMPGVALLTGRGIQMIADGLLWLLNWVSKRLNGPMIPERFQALVGSSTLAVLLFILLSGFYPVTADIIAKNPDWKAQIYPDTARWLAQNTNASANFATIDIGHLGYWSQRPIIDIVGLAQPDVAAKIAEGDFGYAIREYQPDMVLIGFSWLPEIQSKDWFQTNYVPRHYFKYSHFEEPLLLFSRREGVKIQTNSVLPQEITPLDIDFNQQIRLTGYHLNQPLTAGSPLNLTLFWEAVAPIAVDFTVFVQVINAKNEIVAQKDDKPQNGFYATPFWQPGETITDPHLIPLAPDVPAGQYDILIGLYEVESGLRLQILDERGQFKSDHLRLSNVELMTSKN